MLTVLLGGARSGKSAGALRMAGRSDEAVCFVATSPEIAGDDDLAVRIARHRAERPPTWITIEAEIDLAAAIGEAGERLVVVDCLTVWIGNLVHHGHDDESVERMSRLALAAVASRTSDTIVVSNEVGLGIVPADAMTRRYRDLLGRVNQEWVAAAARAYLMVAGRALPLTAPEDL